MMLGGGFEFGEVLEDVVCCEFCEEIGYMVKVGEFLGIYLCVIFVGQCVQKVVVLLYMFCIVY